MAIMLEVRPDVSEREQIYHLKEQLEFYLNAQEDIRQAVINATKGEKGDPGPPGPKGDPGGGGTGSYSDLTDKPQIEGVTLEGNKTASNLGLVPETRKVNNKSLSDDITLTANDVSALPSSTTIPSPGTGSSYPVMDGTRALGSNAGYARVDHVHPSDTSRVPTSRTVNGHALSSDVTVNASEVPYTPPTGITADDVAEALTDIYSNMLNPEEILEELGRKVDKVTGKGLSTNDYTTAEKTKLAGIETGAEVNVQSDWDETDTTSDAYIKNKPTIPAGVTVDSALDSTSENPVQNKVIKGALDTRFMYMNGGTTFVTMTDNYAHTYTLPALDSNSKIDAQYLPSYVDDVIEAFAVTGATPLSAGWLTKAPGFPALTPESGKIYVLMQDSGDYAANTQFRWGGSAYVKLADGGVSSITNTEIDTIVAS